MYSIDNFLEIKDEIYKYCRNLSLTRRDGIIIPHKDRADDLFQEVYLNSIKYLQKLKGEVNTLEDFRSKVKVITWWTHCARFNRNLKINRISLNLNYYQETLKSEHEFFEKYTSENIAFQDLKKLPDYKVFTKNLNKDEIYVIDKLIEGYSFKDILEIKKDKFTKKYLSLIKHNLKINESRYRSPKKEEKINDSEFLKQKLNIKNFKQIFNTKYKLKIYSMYLRGFNYAQIGEICNKRKSQIGVEIYRINKQINNNK